MASSIGAAQFVIRNVHLAETMIVEDTGNVILSKYNSSGARFLCTYNNGTVFLKDSACVTIAGDSSTLCYQESANVSTICGGLATGFYAVEDGVGANDWTYDGVRAIDESFSTFDQVTGFGATEWLFINYSQPTNALNSSLWLIKDETGEFNITPLGSCFNQEPLQLAIRASDFINSMKYYCHDGTTYQEMNDTLASTGTFYEEGMWWNISS